MSLINYVTRIHFAENVLEDAMEAELSALRSRRPLVISDHGEARAGLVDRLLQAIPRKVEPLLFEVPEGRATEDAAAAAGALYRDGECDALIGFGDAAAIDLAKAVGVEVSHGGPLGRYAGVAGGAARIRNLLPPLLAVPTTAGAGTEAGGVAVIAMEGSPNIALVSPCLVPRVVICDPTLTLDLSPENTAGAGMDAFTHCMETYIASAYNPPADGIALDGLRRAATVIERVVDDGGDLDARREMMAAALNGALAQQKGLGAAHAMSHALAGATGRPGDHGTLNAILLPAVLDFNEPAAAPRYDDIRRELRLPPRALLAESVARLRERIGLPSSLSRLGIDREMIEEAAVFAASDYANRTNPRKATAEDYLAMMKAVL